MTLRTRENIEIWKNKHWITLSGEVALEEDMDRHKTIYTVKLVQCKLWICSKWKNSSSVYGYHSLV